MKCGFCDDLSFIDLEAFKEHMVQNHPDSEIAKRQSAGLEAVGLFAPDFSPIVLVRNADTPIFSCLAGDAMKLGYHILMQGRQIYDDWCLIRIFQDHNIKYEEALDMLKELRDKRAGN